MNAELPTVLAIIGPTASGKSSLALVLARELSGEVISADSMQIYRGMDIGTATLAPQERQGVRHHLLDILDPGEESTVAEFQALGRRAIDAVRAAGQVPIVVGGSGLYVSALLDDLNFGGTDPVIRERWEHLLREQGAPALHARLAERDPAAAAAILPGNGRRIVRALEYNDVTGTRFPARFAPAPTYPRVCIGLHVPWAELDQRIEHRVHQMWESGLVAETRELMAGGLGRTAAGAIGYAQAIAQITGEITEDEARAHTILATRRFARRQVRWMRRDHDVTWIEYDAPDLVDRVLAIYRGELQSTRT